ncbi:MAG: hypothetical protein RJA93_651 [Pseudomonadota bacterium]
MNKIPKQKNVLGEDIEPCSMNPVTGWFRDGSCNTDKTDVGMHCVCAKVTETYIKKSTNKKIKKFNIKNVWVVRQFENEYNPIHYHDGHISGVGYLKVPKSLNEDKRSHKHNLKTHGTIDFIHGSRGFLNKSIYNHIPKVGDMILFPNYLMHTVYPFQSGDERRSFSFNATIDEKITNVFKHE